MKRTLSIFAVILVALAIVFVAWHYGGKANIKPLHAVSTDELKPVRQSTCTLDNGCVTITTKKGSKSSGFGLDVDYDLTDYKAVKFTVENPEDALVLIYVTLSDSPTKYLRFNTARPMSVGTPFFLKPYEKRELEITFPRPLAHPDVEAAFHTYDYTKNMMHTPYSHAFGMASYAGDLSSVKEILVDVKYRVTDAAPQRTLRIYDFEIVSGKRPRNPKVTDLAYEEFFPFIDQYGQYKHHEWEGKVHSDSDLQSVREKEEKLLEQYPSPANVNKYGGWTAGPRFEATGRFYFKKVDGKWWFIDPEGCLWWSHGAVRVTPSSAVTPLDNRKFFFENLPAEGDTMAQFYYTNDALLKPYYEVRGHKETYDFSSANIYRKYGDDYKAKYGEMAHRRLRSWGLNTIANSSDKDICLMSKTPYIERLEMKSKPIEGTGGLWWTFSDPFDASFKEMLIAQFKEREKEIKDPYLVGFFVDNELKWGHESYLATQAAKNPSSSPAKRELVKHYRKKYRTIAALNKVWGSDYASWDALLENRKSVPQQAHADLVEFNDLIIHKYFRNIREVFDEYAPGVLYLGCRFSGVNGKALTIGAEYCDAISHNYYLYSLADYKQPEGVDKPMIVGEFHFGTMSQGLFHYSLIEVANQKERGKAYAEYVRSALRNPNIVGTHWHQFADQATTGRFDGENFQVGFVDVCDTPYFDMVEYIREVGYEMYEVRYNGK